MTLTIDYCKTDITTLNVDAIVNAANSSLLGGGGVDGAIHRSAGPKLLEACKTLNGCKPGEAKVTPGFSLIARWVIHTVGPIWKDGTHNEEAILATCYKSVLQQAKDLKIKTLAFPNISTGIYGFPKQRAAEIAIQSLSLPLIQDTELQTIIFSCFDEENHRIYESLLTS